MMEPKPRERRSSPRIDWDGRLLVALFTLAAVFGLAFVSEWKTGTVDVPPWATTLSGVIVTFYFATKTNGTTTTTTGKGHTTTTTRGGIGAGQQETIVEHDERE